MFNRKNHYIVFTSSFVTANPGAGSWTSVIYDSTSNDTKSLKRYSNFHLDTTPNILDLEAIVDTLDKIKSNIEVTIVHDSNYINKVMTKWIFLWEEKDFKTSGGKPISNSELVKKLSKLRHSRKVCFIYTARNEKPIYNTMANYYSRLYTLGSIEKKPPADILKFFK